MDRRVGQVDRLDDQVSITNRQATDLNEREVQVQRNGVVVAGVTVDVAAEERTNQTDVGVGAVIPAPVTTSTEEERAVLTRSPAGAGNCRVGGSAVEVTDRVRVFVTVANFRTQTSTKTKAAVSARNVEEARTECVADADVVDRVRSRRKIRCLCSGNSKHPCCSAEDKALKFHVLTSKFETNRETTELFQKVSILAVP